MGTNLISAAEAARMLGITPQRATQLIGNGQLDRVGIYDALYILAAGEGRDRGKGNHHESQRPD